MTPDFALSLSFDGLTLLRQMPDGWARIGAVALDEPDLEGAMAKLRDKALAIDPSGDAVLLILPNEQIRYLDVPDPGAKRPDAARTALDGATPYPVSDLAVDCSVDAGRLLVAAVARETLAEAEAFAAQHRFRPVASGAIAPDGAFNGAVFFGAARSWGGRRPTRPGAALTVIEPTDAAFEPPAPPEPKPAKDTGPAPSFATRRSGAEPTLPASDSDPVVTERRFVPAPPEKKAPKRKAPPPPEAKTEKTEPKAGTPPVAADPPAKDSVPAPADTKDPAPAGAPASDLAAAAARATLDAPFQSGLLARLSKPGADRDGAAPKPIAPPQGPPAGAKRAGPAAPDMALFGTRDTGNSGRRPLGLILAGALLALLIVVGGAAALLFGGGKAQDDIAAVDPATLAAPEPPAPPVIPDAFPDAEVAAPEPVASTPEPEPEISLESAVAQAVEPEPAPAEAEDLPEPSTSFDAEQLADAELETADIADPTPPRGPLSPEEAAATYAATGIWQRAPETPGQPPVDSVDDLYIASLDPTVRQFDAVALPRSPGAAGETPPADPGLPPPPDLTFDFDDRGLVRATPDGALTPEGLRIFTGRPPVVPPLRRNALSESVTGLPPVDRFQGIRPQARPEDLIESRERAILGGLTRSELALYRPVERPLSAQEQGLAAAGSDATAQAIAASLRPAPRPDDMDAIVARATPAEPDRPANTVTAAAPAATVTTASASPNIPTTAEVARAATERNAVRLNRTALFGIYGTAANRRALVRLSNGNYEKVSVGDRLDGGRVVAIGEDELRYQRGNRTITLEMPRG